MKTLKIIESVKSKMLLDNHLLTSFARTAPYRYKRFNIEKKNGGKRLLAIPSKELREIQRFIYIELLKDLPVHQCVTSYVKNKSIINNVLPHSENSFFLKCDIKNFFPSINPEIFLNQLSSHKIVIDHEEEFINLVFWKPKREFFELCIGAPTSPIISNFILYNFDEKIFQYCTEKNIIYTRYADDMTFSCNEPGFEADILEFVKKSLLYEFSNTLKLNNEKTLKTSNKNFVKITGIVITNNGKLSVGRAFKRKIFILCHQNSNLNTNQALELLGKISFVQSIENDFIEKLQRKYGDDIIKKIKCKI